MSLQVNTTNLITKRVSVLFGVLFVAILVLSPVSARAQCANWDASGRLDIQQQNTVNPIELTLQQNGRVLSGKAQTTFTQVKGFHTQIDRVTASVDGTIDGNRISIQLYWSNSSPLLGRNKVGVYNGSVLATGRLDGESYEKSSPNVRYIWHSQGVLKCIPPPIVPRPVKSSGKAKVSTATAPKSEPAPPMKVPGIIASQVIYSQPYGPVGVVILTWDGGPDHPYAEVWYKVNNGEDTFLVEQGKGSRQMPVERGKYYTFILTDAGKTLATINVAGN